MSVALVKPFAIAKHEGVDQVEAELLNMPQVDPNTVHRFGPGIYIREVTIPAGVMCIGHSHKYAHTNMVLSGSAVAMIDGEIHKIKAPAIFAAPPGRKIIYATEECVWHNIYATTETNVENLEKMLVDKSDTFTDYQQSKKEFDEEFSNESREDFESSFMVESEDHLCDAQIDLEQAWADNVTVKPSTIHGNGLFANSPVNPLAIIAPAIIDGLRTPVSQFVNHAKTPNCFLMKTSTGNVYLTAKCDIFGCNGGGDELTIDYRLATVVVGESV